ncbi:hypothetical protein [Clostridium botulinum]|uniref:hypothetical protein n=1 Tax=Clostridium botulinum TaxID=1491 RepID=UPI0004DA3E3D|nr:hypothetical protein [Clostridium botulinum]KEH99730.1 hypothetical protein Z952_p0054 [Clostridium botulinum C/D str. BKT75002]KEI05208.1 hypothetical protein Z954_0054 [Clostridium botulinum C/D str. BKT2873]QPW62101.1 hypothetical protein IG390_13670 [Clostridium botulinum]
MSFDISENNIKALKFRDELIELLKKYKCSLSTTGKDDGNMVVEFYDKKLNQYNNYIMTDDGENYNLYVENDSSCIMDMIIKDAFDRDCGEMCGLNNIQVTYGIITNNANKAEAKLKEIYNSLDEKDIKTFRLSSHEKLLELNNGKSYFWIAPHMDRRGYRCRKVIIDRNIIVKELYNNILPMCRTQGLEYVEIF